MNSNNWKNGRLGEDRISQHLRKLGYNVVPVYEKEIDDGKGPRVFMASCTNVDQLIAPDLFIIGIEDAKPPNGPLFAWVEAKTKTRFSWYGKGNYFVTGIDLRNFNDYCTLAEKTNVPIYLFFLHTQCDTSREDVYKWGAPATCPTGLFCRNIKFLSQPTNKSHISQQHGSSGMIYWRPDVHLKKIAELEEV